MKKLLLATVTFLILTTLSSHFSTARAQGSLTPPGAPAPTMKTLAQIEPRTPISSLPFTIAVPGSYYVVSNLTGVAGSNGISVTVSDVSIDLGGFALIGAAGAMDGINCTGDRLAVFNGTIRNWGANGINVTIGAEDDWFHHLTLTGNGLGGLIGPTGALAEDCIIDGNGGVGVKVGGGSIVRGCVIRNNTGGGFNHFAASGEKTSVTVSGCNFAINGGSAVILNGGCLATGNNITGQSGVGMFITGPGNRVEANHFTANNIGLEFSSSSSSNLVVCNSFQGNTNAFFPGGTNQAVAPFISALNLATNSNPYANFSF